LINRRIMILKQKEICLYLKWLSDICGEARVKSISRVNGENQWMVARRSAEKRKIRAEDQGISLEKIVKTWPMIIKRRHGISAGRNRIGLFLYAPGGRSGTQEREQDEQHEAEAEEARNVGCSAQEIEAVRCLLQAHGCKTRSFTRRRKKKRTNNWRRRSAFLSCVLACSMKITRTHVKIACQRARGCRGRQHRRARPPSRRLTISRS